MPQIWLELARDARRAANELLVGERFRSSRPYSSRS